MIDLILVVLFLLAVAGIEKAFLVILRKVLGCTSSTTET